MADLERRPGRGMTRQEREQRAYQLTMATGALSLVAVAGLVLAVVNVIGFTWPILAAVLAVACFVMLRRTMGLR